MNINHQPLNKTKILRGALGRRDLSDDQDKALEEIINGFALLISSSTPDLPTRGDVGVFSEIIKGSLICTFKILDTYVKPRESQRSTGVPAGRS